MAPIDVEKTIEELTLGEKVALTAGKHPEALRPTDRNDDYRSVLPRRCVQNQTDCFPKDAISGTRHPFLA